MLLFKLSILRNISFLTKLALGIRLPLYKHLAPWEPGRLFLVKILVTLTVVMTATVATPSQTRSTKVSRKPNYSSFSHGTHVTQQKLACDSCHKFPSKNWKEVRKGDSAFPDVADFPEHSSCLDCHRQQFFARERPAPAICSNCHVNVTPRDSTRFLFPSLGDISDSAKLKRDQAAEFVVAFPHDKHLDVVGLNTPGPRAPNRVNFTKVVWTQNKRPSEPKSCPVCHQTIQPQGKSDQEYVTTPPKDLGDNYWLKKGTFKSSPNSHAVCFSCHNADLGIAPAPSECNACHKLATPQASLKPDYDPKLFERIGANDKTISDVWNRRISSGTFRHEGGDHPNVSCMSCHSANTMNTVAPKTLMVPVRSCGGADGCHITATSDDGGILNYEMDQRKTNSGFVCTKCHLSFGKEVVPPSHIAAIPKAVK